MAKRCCKAKSLCEPHFMVHAHPTNVVSPSLKCHPQSSRGLLTGQWMAQNVLAIMVGHCVLEFISALKTSHQQQRKHDRYPSILSGALCPIDPVHLHGFAPLHSPGQRPLDSHRAYGESLPKHYEVDPALGHFLWKSAWCTRQ